MHNVYPLSNKPSLDHITNWTYYVKLVFCFWIKPNKRFLHNKKQKWLTVCFKQMVTVKIQKVYKQITSTRNNSKLKPFFKTLDKHLDQYLICFNSLSKASRDLRVGSCHLSSFDFTWKSLDGLLNGNVWNWYKRWFFCQFSHFHTQQNGEMWTKNIC